MMSQSASAPEKMRMKVKLAASMLVCFSAARQRSELLANAIIANRVRKKIRAFRWETFNAHCSISNSEIGAILNRQSVRILRTRRRPASPGLWRGRHFFYSFLNWFEARKHLVRFRQRLEWNAIADREEFIPHREHIRVLVRGIDRIL